MIVVWGQDSYQHLLLPVSVVCFAISSVLRELLCDGGDPNGSESHALNVIQLEEPQQWIKFDKWWDSIRD